MAYASRRFVSVFYDLAHEYPAIYRDNDALATWLRLLMIADAIWPAPAMLPRSVQQRPLDVLALAGLVDVDDDEFRIRGLDKLRQERREAARRAAEAMHAKRNADADADALRAQPNVRVPSTAQHKRSLRSLSTPTNGQLSLNDELNVDSLVEDSSSHEVKRTPTENQRVLAWLKDHGAARPVGYVLTDMQALVKGYGAEAVIRALESVDAKTTKQYIKLAENVLAVSFEDEQKLVRQKASETNRRNGHAQVDIRSHPDYEATRRALEGGRSQ